MQLAEKEKVFTYILGDIDTEMYLKILTDMLLEKRTITDEVI